MGTIRIDDARAGMVLEMDARDRTGRLLLKSGQPLTEKALKILRMWGVTELDVDGVDETASEPTEASPSSSVDRDVLDAARAEAEELFRHTDRRHPVIAELLRLSAQRLAGRLARPESRVS